MASLSISPTSPPLHKLSSDEEPTNPTTTLLPHSSPSSSESSRPFLFSCLLITTCISLTTSFAFAFLLLASPTKPNKEVARNLSKLPHPVVILISSDGFRFGYQFKTSTPNIHRLIRNGTEAETGLIPVFPTLTFPNHYSIVTGLYPSYHGIINNWFTDPVTGEIFTMQSHESKWWLGEPLWETVANQGKKAATFFWPGSEVKKGNWTCPDKYCQHYNGSVPFEERVDTVLSYFDLPFHEIPVFITLYFEDPDHQGHQVGPDDPEVTSAVAHIDSLIGRLISGLEKRGVFEDVTIILLGDHGMVGTCDKKLIYLEDLSPWVEIKADWVQSTTPILAITPPDGVSTAEVVSKMNEGFSSGKIEHGNYLKMFLKENLPERLHYASSYRIPPIIGLLQEGYKVELKRSNNAECGGAHGYDNSNFSMRTIFIAHGPQFGKGRKVQSFENVQIYNVIASILKLKGAPNNGSQSIADNILLSIA
ncbi:hypothetical protein LUZ62_076358 [Rhynchospora pubera]|uniref:Uncharacterized protein n=1 Tax=Rhynchospora pubera TaxID=906938 RepID=A0AAV8DIC6_9POAL|nr:hypothetical protein LUZ62_076358 [Rhynchospora pubera]